MSRSQLAETVLSGHLDRNERLLWSGQPRGGVVFRAQDAFLIPFSVVWTAFAVFWELAVLVSVGSDGTPLGLVFSLFGLPFVLIGLYLLVGRFFADSAGRARTYYGITNERIIIVSGLFVRQVKSLQLRTLSDVSLTERGDGSGMITFGPVHPMSHFFPAGAWPGARYYSPPLFDLIDRAKEAYDIIRAAQRAPA